MKHNPTPDEIEQINEAYEHRENVISIILTVAAGVIVFGIIIFCSYLFGKDI
jgi:hypothetical protein